MDEDYKVEMKVDPQNNRYPYCLVWTALPCITCCLPCVGHTGIGRSDGVLYDFVGMGPMHSGQLAFGAPLKYLILQHENYTPEQWDEGISKANQKFSKTNHNLFTNNCHHHVAQVLNNIRYKGREDWGQIDIGLLALRGTHTGLCSYFIYVVFLLLLWLILF